VENKFVATICVSISLSNQKQSLHGTKYVLFPAGQFIVHSQRDTLLKFALMIGCQADNELIHLHSQTDVKILRDMTVGPKFSHAILFEGNSLDGFPAQEGIVADERCSVSITDGELDGHIDEVGEVCDTVFKSVVGYLHNTGSMLQNRDFGTLVHLKCTIYKAILWLPSC
jgi:hypothetical protein